MAGLEGAAAMTVGQSRPLYREQTSSATAHIGNLMYDSRVRRGLASTHVPGVIQAAPAPAFGRASGRLEGSKTAEAAPAATRPPPGTQRSLFDSTHTLTGATPAGAQRSAVPGTHSTALHAPRTTAHAPLDMSAYLTESVAPRVRTDADTQTHSEAHGDPFRPRQLPAYTTHTQTHMGIDASTQVPHGSAAPRPREAAADGVLFDFDDAVAPIVAVLVEKTLEEAAESVARERELAQLARRREAAAEDTHTHTRKGAELVQREAAAARDKEQRVAVARENAAAVHRVMQKFAARSLARALVSRAYTHTHTQLTAHGYWADPVVAEVRQHVQSSILPAVADRTIVDDRARGVADALIGEALLLAAATQRAAQAAANRVINMYVAVQYMQTYVAAPASGEEEGEDAGEGSTARDRGPRMVSARLVLGPVPLKGSHTVRDAEAAVGAWLHAHASEEPSRIVSALSAGEALRLWSDGDVLDGGLHVMDLSEQRLAGLELRPVSGAFKGVAPAILEHRASEEGEEAATE